MVKIEKKKTTTIKIIDYFKQIKIMHIFTKIKF